MSCHLNSQPSVGRFIRLMEEASKGTGVADKSGILLGFQCQIVSFQGPTVAINPFGTPSRQHPDRQNKPRPYCPSPRLLAKANQRLPDDQL